MIEAGAGAPESPAEVPARAGRVWRIALVVVSFQVIVIAAAAFLFSALGLANDGTGSCGGG